MNTQDKIDIMQAAFDGADLETDFKKQGNWLDWGLSTLPDWNWNDHNYRIKPKAARCWVNIYSTGIGGATWRTEIEALDAAEGVQDRTVLMREVVE